MLRMVIQIIIMVAVVAGSWKVFEKAGLEGWKSLVPFYNLYLIVIVLGKVTSLGNIKLVEGKEFKIESLLIFVPLLNLYFLYLASIQIAKSFGKDEKFGLGLLLLPMVFYPMLGFGDAKYSN